MFRLSKLLEKLEDKLDARFKSWLARNKAKLPTRVPAVIVGWYFYGMFLNSLRLGIASTFHQADEEIQSIWVLNPFKNWGAVFTGFGFVTTLVIVLIICLITKKGYIWFSGYKYTHDPRGFDILPDGTHGTSGFLTEKEMREFLELSPAGKTEGMILGKVKKHPDDPDAYALYAAHRMVAGDNNNLLCIGAPGSGKSRGFIIPFLMGCAKRGESAFITDAKGELFERLSPYFRQHGFYVKAVNFLDMEHSDGWNCLYGLNSIRGFNMSAQIVVQSLSQWQEKYPGKEWENQLATFDQTLYMGCNDLTSAKYISEKCGKVTISVLNNQMPMMPLFSPVYSSTRPYSQTRSNTQRDLMNPDEVLRLENRKCLALFKGHKPALLYKMTPEELPDYAGLTTCRVIDYIPEWRRKETEAAPQKKAPVQKEASNIPKPPDNEKQPDRSEQPPAYDLAEDDEIGMVECTVDSILNQ